jgi:hypothetical protein
VCEFVPRLHIRGLRGDRPEAIEKHTIDFLVRLKPDTTYSSVLPKPDTTYSSVFTTAEDAEEKRRFRLEADRPVVLAV